MAVRYITTAVLIHRNAFLSSQMNCLIKRKINICKEFKLFHISALLNKVGKVKNKNVLQNSEIVRGNLRRVKVWKNMTLTDMAKSMNIPLRDLGLYLPQLNLKPDSIIQDFKIFYAIAEKLNMEIRFVNDPNEVPKEEKKKLYVKQPPSKPENLVRRPPIVTVMGHVDHGKTTLLDSLRNSFVVQQEFGGITQHIGAFSVEVKPGERITFIDTPGHAAFKSMRSRGANVTDIVVLVIAADDGVMEQTLESIKIAREAEVVNGLLKRPRSMSDLAVYFQSPNTNFQYKFQLQHEVVETKNKFLIDLSPKCLSHIFFGFLVRIIIAVNKIDKAKASAIDKIKENLLLEGIQVEDKGGSIQLVPISALKKINLDQLTETILLEAEELNLKGDPTGLVEGVVIESKKEKMGIVATVIVKRGTLEKKKIIVAGKAHGKVRRMLDENGKDYEKALPSTPVQVFGWKELPLAGDEVFEVKSEKEASMIVNERIKQSLVEKQEADSVTIQKKAEEQQRALDEFKKSFQELTNSKEKRKFYFDTKLALEKKNSQIDTFPHVKLILKGDVYGSVEVLLKILHSYDKNEECKLSVIEASVGDVKQSDLELAEYFEAIIYAFNVNLHVSAKELVQEKNVDIRYHNVIYKLIDDLRKELSARIPPRDEENVHGEAEVLENFVITYASKKTSVAGARCVKGQLNKDSLYKVLRNDEVIYEGKLVSMKNEKKVVKTILKGTECGLLFDSFRDKFKPGDRIICYDLIKVHKGTSWDPGF